MFNLRSFDLNLLTIFEAVYDTRSASRAADQLALSQAAVSHALGRLRQVCGDELFIRAGSQFVPTKAAQILYPKVQEALRLLRRSLSDVHNFDPATSERHFNIVIPHPLGPVIAQTLRVSTANAAPLIRLRMDTRTMPPDLSADLRSGEVDLVIDWLRIEQDQFVNKKILDETLMVVVRRGHPRIQKAPSLAEIRREELVWLHPRLPRQQAPKAVQQIEELGLRAVLRISEWLEAPTLVASFDLITIVPRSLALTLTARMHLDVYPFPAKLSLVPVFAIWHESRRADAAHIWLRNLVAGELVRQAEL